MRIKKIRCKHEGKFHNIMFSKFYAELRITHNFSALRIPQQKSW